MAFDLEAFKAYIESDQQLPFDLYAQDPKEWAWLQKIIPGMIVSSAGGQAPFQAEGIYHGYPFYYRDRHGVARLNIGELDGEAPYDTATALYTASKETAEFRGGEQFVHNLVELVPQLKPGEFRYHFSGKKLVMLNDGGWSYTVSETETQERAGWGFTPEAAFESMFTPIEYLIEHGCSAAQQYQMLTDQEFDPTPVNEDKRKYPVVAPEFVVKL
jgi:hypothetical protein